MRTFQSGLLLATLLLSAAPAAAFDIDFKVTNDVSAYVQIEKPTTGHDFTERVVSYLRFVPKKKGPVFPVFINTHNYLMCANNEKKWTVNEVKQVSFERRSGVEVLGFFFDKPTCADPTFYMEPIIADS